MGVALGRIVPTRGIVEQLTSCMLEDAGFNVDLFDPNLSAEDASWRVGGNMVDEP